MMISRKLRYVYITVPRAGSTTVMSVLGRHYSVSKTVLGHCNTIPGYAQGYYHFTVVRNPYTRAISIWYYLVQRCGDRHEFVKDGAPGDDPAGFLIWLYSRKDIDQLQWRIPAVRFQWQQLGGNRLDGVLHLEGIEEEWKQLPFYNGMPEEWPRENDSARIPLPGERAINTRPKPPEDYLTPKTKRVIRRIFNRDFLEYGYKV